MADTPPSLDDLFADVKAKIAAMGTASDALTASTTALTAAQSDNAAKTAAFKDAHDAVVASVNALEAALDALKT